jgi:two-component system, response regulator RegA
MGEITQPEAGFPEENLRVLVADDDSAFSDCLAGCLRGLGHPTDVVHDAPCLWRRLAAEPPYSVVILEPNLPGGIWLPVLRQARLSIGGARLVVTTSFPSIALAREARALAIAFFAKPVPPGLVAGACGPTPDTSHTCTWRSPRLGEMSLARIEWEYLNRILHAYGGNISRTAQILAIPRQTVYRKLRVHPPPR